MQLNVWTGTKWVNVFDGNDFKNMSIDLHRVAKVVEDQVAEIDKAVKNANAAMDQANKAVDNSNVNKTAIDDVNKAVDEAKQSASDALDKIKNLASDSTVQDIQKSLKKTTDDVAKLKDDQAQHLKDVTGQINDAVAKSKAAADSLTAKTEELQTAVKNAQSDATVATQTASEANVTAIDAKSDAAVATATAKQVTVDMTNVKSDVVAIKATASEATITAGNAASDAAAAKVTASGASVVATDAKNNVAKMAETVNGISTTVAGVDKKVDDLGDTVTKNQTDITQTKDAIALKADKTAVDNVNKQVSQNTAQLKVQADQIGTKVSNTELKKVSDKADNALTANAKAESDAQAASSKADSALAATVKNTTAIDQNSKAIALKANQTTVDALNKTVTDNSAAVKVLNGEITSKVDSTTVNKMIDGKGFTTSQTVQTLIDQKANQISQTITDVKTTVDGNGKAISTANDKISNLTQTIDGIQTTVKNKADQSQVTQLSNQITAKVSTKDYQTEIAALEKNLNLRVQKGDLISQINLEAGGPGLIQVDNGKGKLLLDADSVVFKNRAFIPSAAIIDIAADKITSGTLDAGNIRVINLTADTIHGGTLDVGDMNIKNLTADDITTGTLTGVVIKSDNKKGQSFTLSNADMMWKDNESTALLGRDLVYASGSYEKYNEAFTVAANQGIVLTGNLAFDKKGNVLTSFLDYSIRISSGTRSTIVPDPLNDYALQLNSGMGACIRLYDRDYFDTKNDPFTDYDTMTFNTYHSVSFNLGVSTYEISDGVSAPTSVSQFNIQKNNKVGFYVGGGDSGDAINITAFGGTTHHTPLTVESNFRVTGAKNAIVNTTQGYLAINAYETAEYYFGDIGENNTGNSGEVVVGIDRIFNETVNTKIEYQVFITPYSDCHIWVEKRYDNRFVVKSDKSNAEFGWEIKAKRKGYETDRLRHVNK